MNYRLSETAEVVIELHSRKEGKVICGHAVKLPGGTRVALRHSVASRVVLPRRAHPEDSS